MSRPEHIIRLAQLKLIRDGAELEAEITNRFPGYYMTLYRRFRDAAAESIAAMVYIDPEDAASIAALQRDVKVFDRFVEETKDFIGEGQNLDQHTSDQDRQEVIDMLLSAGPDGEQQAVDLGLIDPGPPDA